MFTAFPSTAMGLTGPLFGFMAASTGIAPLFAASAGVVICSMGFATRLLALPRK